MTRSAVSLLAVLLLPHVVCAHAVGISCTPRGARIEVEAYYDDNTPAIQAKVRVLDTKREEVAAGVTDGKGRWTFAKPGPGKYEVHLDAGGGHRAKTTLAIPGAASPQEASPSVPSADTPSRAQFTRFPWDNLLVGLAIIAIGGGALVLLLRKRAGVRQI